jgi:hypothetical protein
VAEDVMAAAGQSATGGEENRVQDLKERLRSLNPEDLGDFRL